MVLCLRSYYRILSYYPTNSRSISIVSVQEIEISTVEEEEEEFSMSQQNLDQRANRTNNYFESSNKTKRMITQSVEKLRAGHPTDPLGSPWVALSPVTELKTRNFCRNYNQWRNRVLGFLLYKRSANTLRSNISQHSRIP